MKKFMLSSLFAVLMVFHISCDAHAQEFCALGSYEAGQNISAYIALVPASAEVSPEGLPPGLSLRETTGDTGKHLSLEGWPMTAGELDFSIYVSEEPGLISCSVSFEPATPQLVLSGNVNCTVGGNVLLSATASVSDGGSLSYQWYSGVGFTAVPISGANSASYVPDTSIPGQFGYYCEVTNTNNGYTSVNASDAVFVTVAEPTVTGIDIETLPLLLAYAPGDSLDTEGLSLRVSYDNGSSTVIDYGFEAYPARFDRAGKQLVELSYQGQHCYYEVDVSIAQAEIEGIGVLSLPHKTEYSTGETVDTGGLVIRAYTKDGHLDIDSGFEIYPRTLKDEGRQSIVVSYEGKNCSFTVDVKDANTLSSVKIASLPTRREYRVGDSVDVSGLSLQLKYGGRTELVTSGFSWSPQTLSQASTQEITVSYGGHTASFSINVKEAPATPSPTAAATAVPTAGPEQPSPSPSSAATKPDRDHEARDVGMLVKIIFFIAVFSLMGLAGYIFYMQKRGRR